MKQWPNSKASSGKPELKKALRERSKAERRGEECGGTVVVSVGGGLWTVVDCGAMTIFALFLRRMESQFSFLVIAFATVAGNMFWWLEICS